MIIIRPPKLSEAGALTSIALKSKQHWGYDEEFMAACQDELSVSVQKLSSPLFTFLVAEMHGVPTAFATLAHSETDNAELEALFVLPDYMGLKIGQQLLQKVIETAKSKGYNKLEIQSDPGAEPFYRKLGAIKISESPSGSIPGRFLPLLQIQL